MFDSESISLVTRIESGPGIIVTHVNNSEGDEVWFVSLDSDYVAEIVKNNSLDVLALSPTDEARLAAVEAALGLNQAPSGDPTPVADSDGSGLVEGASDVPNGTDPVNFDGETYVTGSGVAFINVDFGTGVSTLSQNMTITLNVYDQSSTIMTTETVTFSAGSTENEVELALYSIMNANKTITRMRRKLAHVDGWIVFDWASSNDGSWIEIILDSSASVDGVVWTVVNY